ncbi:MAG: PEGA domain-containing protein [Polyangiaceae bacterium]|nr:PEGA domain-containing protein [Polyangiaceae bacterium]
MASNHPRQIIAGSLAILISMLAATPVCFAEPPGRYIIPVEVTRIMTNESDAQADALTAVTRSEFAKLPGWSLARSNHSFEELSIKLNCPTPPDPVCYVRAAHEMNTDRFIWGTIEQVDDLAIGSLHMWQRFKGISVVQLSYSATLTDPNDPELRRIVRSALMTLTGGRPMGAVEINFSHPNGDDIGDVSGEVYVDNVHAGRVTNGNLTVPVRVGEHRINVRAPGFANLSTDITVGVNETVPLTLYPVTQATGGDTPDGGGPNYRKIGAYGAIGAGGALGLIGLINSLGGGKSGDSFLFVGIGAGTAGVGTFLLVLDGESEKNPTNPTSPTSRAGNDTARSRVRISPYATPSRSGVDLRITF